jgi:hypothetical protein
MGALTIAFDITIVGALALPWVYLVIHLFFSEGENHIQQALNWVNKHKAQVPAGILLFAMTYTLGSAVSRIAQDFFNDDDLYVQTDGHLLRWPVTEDRIRAHVYCDDDKQDLLPNNPKEADSAMAREIRDLQSLLLPGDPDCAMARKIWDLRRHNPESACKAVMSAWIPWNKEDNPNGLVKIATHIFGIQENTLMDKGDYSARLRQLHDQIMVLRGASFSGLIAFSLCLFAWGAILTCNPAPADKAGSRNEIGSHDKPAPRGPPSGDNPHPWVRWILAVAANVFALLLTAVALIALVHHIAEGHLRFPPDPPYMEFTLFLLAGAGLVLLLPSLLWDSLPPSLCLASKDVAGKAGPAGTEKTDTPAKEAAQAGKEGADTPAKGSTHTGKETAAPPYLRIKNWGSLVALSFILTLAAFLGWWSTEVIYRDQVIYSYDSQFSSAQGSAKAKK